MYNVMYVYMAGWWMLLLHHQSKPWRQCLPSERYVRTWLLSSLNHRKLWVRCCILSFYLFYFVLLFCCHIWSPWMDRKYSQCRDTYYGKIWKDHCHIYNRWICELQANTETLIIVKSSIVWIKRLWIWLTVLLLLCCFWLPLRWITFMGKMCCFKILFYFKTIFV